MPTCKDPTCGFSGTEDQFEASMAVYSDFTCPKCGTTNVDTSDINAAWAELGKTYAYGNDNVLEPKP